MRNRVTFLIFILIIVANITTLVLNANKLQDKAVFKIGNFTDERQRFNAINSIFTVGIPFLVWLIIFGMFRYNGGKGLNQISGKSFNSNKLNVLRYQMFWLPLTLAIVFLILSNFVNSLRNVKNIETEEDESVSVSGLIISFVSFGIFVGLITYTVTN